MKFNCPIEGCGKAFGTPHGAINHVQNKNDGNHSVHDSRREIREAVAEENEASITDWEGASPESFALNEPDSYSGGLRDQLDGSPDPSVSGGPSSTDPTEGTGDGDDGEPECPECGGNVYFSLPEDSEYDYGCPNCSDIANDKIYAYNHE